MLQLPKKTIRLREEIRRCSQLESDSDFHRLYEEGVRDFLFYYVLWSWSKLKTTHFRVTNSGILQQRTFWVKICCRTINVRGCRDIFWRKLIFKRWRRRPNSPIEFQGKEELGKTKKTNDWWIFRVQVQK